MKILIFWKCHVGWFFLSQEDGLGNTKNKETAKKIQNQEVKMSMANRKCCFSFTFLISSPPLLFSAVFPFFLTSLLQITGCCYAKQDIVPGTFRQGTKQRPITWNLGSRDFQEEMGGFLGGSECDDRLKGHTWILVDTHIIQQVLLISCPFMHTTPSYCSIYGILSP